MYKNIYGQATRDLPKKDESFTEVQRGKPKAIKCSPGQKKIMGQCIIKRPEDIKQHCITHGKHFNRIKMICVKPNPKDRMAAVRESLRVHTDAGIVDTTLRNFPDKFLKDFIGTHHVSRIGRGNNEALFVRLSFKGHVYDIGVGGVIKPFTLALNVHLPDSSVTPEFQTLGIWTGGFSEEGMPYYTKGNKIWKYDGYQGVIVHTTPEILRAAMDVSSMYIKKVYASLPTVKPKVMKPKPTALEVAAAKQASKQAKHARDAKKKYERMKKRMPYDAHKMLREATPGFFK